MDEEDGRGQLLTLSTQILLQLAGHPRISHEKLARRLDVTMRTVQRHLTDLEVEGYVDVDRSKKPFEYRIDWTKEWPTLDGVRLIILHPQVIEALRGLSGVAHRAYTGAREEGRTPEEALRDIFAGETAGAAV